jgi:FkbM family methyltransferase
MLTADSPPPYERLMREGACELLGIDLHEEECERLVQHYRDEPNAKFLSAAVGNGSTRRLYICSLKSTSSLFKPNVALCSEFHGFGEHLQVLSEAQVQTVRLDDLNEVGRPDYLKSDTQGAELLLLEGGPTTLSQVMVAELEVEFIEQYEGQPLWGDVDRSMRQIGFLFHTFTGYGTRPMKPLLAGHRRYSGRLNQWLWANAIYVRDFRSWPQCTEEQLLATARVLHDVYGSLDFVCRALDEIDKINGSTLSREYVRALAERDLLRA